MKTLRSCYKSFSPVNNMSEFIAAASQLPAQKENPNESPATLVEGMDEMLRRGKKIESSQTLRLGAKANGAILGKQSSNEYNEHKLGAFSIEISQNGKEMASGKPT